MDTLIYSVLRITVLVLILRTLFRLFSYPRSKSFMFLRKPSGENAKAATALPTDQSEPDKTKESDVEMVLDEFCNKEIPRHQSYILLDDDNRRLYFSSWECRQKYIDGKKKS